MSQLIDLSHPVRDGLVTYPGIPGPVISDHLSRQASKEHYAPGTEFQIGRISLVANTGTYVDAPFHRYREGADLARLPLEALAHLDGLVVRAGRVAEGQPRAIGPEAFAGAQLAGRAVLIHTGWDVHFGRPAYGKGHPFLTGAAAELLTASQVALVGIDSLNIDDDADGERPAHTRLLAAGIPICEHMTNLGSLPDAGFRFHAAPVKVERFGSFPVRAYAVVD